MTTLESWRIIVENEHNDVQKMLDDWENEQQAAILSERELSDKIAELVKTLKLAYEWLENEVQEPYFETLSEKGMKAYEAVCAALEDAGEIEL